MEQSPFYRERLAWIERVKEIQSTPRCFCGAGRVGESSEVEYGDEIKHELTQCLRVRKQ